MADPSPQLTPLPAPRAHQVARAQTELAKHLVRITKQYGLTAAELASLLADALSEATRRLVAAERAKSP